MLKILAGALVAATLIASPSGAFAQSGGTPPRSQDAGAKGAEIAAIIYRDIDFSAVVAKQLSSNSFGLLNNAQWKQVAISSIDAELITDKDQIYRIVGDHIIRNMDDQTLDAGVALLRGPEGDHLAKTAEAKNAGQPAPAMPADAAADMRRCAASPNCKSFIEAFRNSLTSLSDPDVQDQFLVMFFPGYFRRVGIGIIAGETPLPAEAQLTEKQRLGVEFSRAVYSDLDLRPMLAKLQSTDPLASISVYQGLFGKALADEFLAQRDTALYMIGLKLADVSSLPELRAGTAGVRGSRGTALAREIAKAANGDHGPPSREAQLAIMHLASTAEGRAFLTKFTSINLAAGGEEWGKYVLPRALLRLSDAMETARAAASAPAPTPSAP